MDRRTPSRAPSAGLSRARFTGLTHYILNSSEFPRETPPAAQLLRTYVRKKLALPRRESDDRRMPSHAPSAGLFRVTIGRLKRFLSLVNKLQSPAANLLLLATLAFFGRSSNAAALGWPLSEYDIAGDRIDIGERLNFAQVGASAVDGETDWKNVGTTWSTASNWTAVSGSAPPAAGDVAWFKVGAVTSPNVTTAVSISGLYFSSTGSSGYAITRTTPGAFTLTGYATTIGTEVSDATAVAIAANNTSGTNTFTVPITLAPTSGSTSTFYQAGGGILDLSSSTTAISGAGIALNLTGTGTIRLGSGNTYSGGTSVNGTIVELAASSTSAAAGVTSGPVGTGTLTLNDGSTLRSNSGTARTLQNSISTSGNITLGASATQTGTLTFNSTNLTTPATFALAGDTTLTTNVATTINNVISGSFGLTKAGPSSLTLGATNTYNGGTTIQAGILNIGTTQTLGDGTGTLTLSGGTLNTTGSRSATSAPIPNNVSVAADSAITTSSNAGTVTLNFTGTLTGTGGTLTVRNDATTTTGQFDVRFSGGDFTMSRPVVIDSGAGGGTTRLNDFNSSGTTHTYNGIISGTGSFNRSVSSGSGGTTIFNADNAYTGVTTVNSGTLLVNGNQTSATGATTVNNTGTVLGGVGVIGSSVTLGNTNPGAILNPGPKGTNATSASVGALTTGALTLTGANTAHFDAFGTATSQWDSVVSTGGISLGSTSTLEMSIASGLNFTPGTTYVLLNGTSLTGTFAGIADNQAVTFNGYDFTADYTTTGFDLIAVPEPSTWEAAALAAAVVSYSFAVNRRARRAVAG